SLSRASGSGDGASRMRDQLTEERLIDFLPPQAAPPALRNRLDAVADTGDAARDTGRRVRIVPQRDGGLHGHFIATRGPSIERRVEAVHDVAGALPAGRLVRSNGLFQLPARFAAGRINRAEGGDRVLPRPRDPGQGSPGPQAI